METLTVQAQWDALIARARQRGFQKALVAELARMGHPVKRQAVSRWLNPDYLKRQKCGWETGMLLLQAAQGIKQ
jgi:hypothetical protein